ncbi:hypothetical protein ABIB25_001188 [Nakamurella sp. UYEF19]|uniref:hypothetical protein n=1 Tax=Nakamurella sp. UYEF19 TaxID=1756392 RepID=UPI003395180B
MTEQVAGVHQWSKGKNNAVVTVIAVVILAVFSGVIWWVISLSSGPNYRVQPAVHRAGNAVRSVTITTNDGLEGSDYERITAEMWGKYGAVRVAWQCANGSIRGRSSQSSALNYAITTTGVRC